jgi:hypothetical protein
MLLPYFAFRGLERLDLHIFDYKSVLYHGLLFVFPPVFYLLMSLAPLS